MRRDIFQALADRTRRANILLVAVQAMTPNALATHFNSSRQAVSKAYSNSQRMRSPKSGAARQRNLLPPQYWQNERNRKMAGAV